MSCLLFYAGRIFSCRILLFCFRLFGILRRVFRENLRVLRCVPSLYGRARKVYGHRDCVKILRDYRCVRIFCLLRRMVCGLSARKNGDLCRRRGFRGGRHRIVCVLFGDCFLQIRDVFSLHSPERRHSRLLRPRQGVF